ncbi:ABC-three component system middle component 2 [Methylorubrum extorquens]|uniref:ABC-three component system middle component 2 n=1 Tax=Methylorubrum extorquens TaxID=408 RepID=UPI003F634806
MGDLKSDKAPFNSPLETGLRALVILEAMYPRPCDLGELTWYDYLVVYTADLGGEDGATAPASLHPPIPGRQDGIIVRRRLIERSLDLMRGVHLVDLRHDADGIRYVAGDDAPEFLETLQAPYTQRLKERARWLADRLSGLSRTEIAAIVDRNIGALTVQFAAPEGDRS